VDQQVRNRLLLACYWANSASSIGMPSSDPGKPCGRAIHPAQNKTTKTCDKYLKMKWIILDMIWQCLPLSSQLALQFMFVSLDAYVVFLS
jgi:hypothetical protein